MPQVVHRLFDMLPIDAAIDSFKTLGSDERRAAQLRCVHVLECVIAGADAVIAMLPEVLGARKRVRNRRSASGAYAAIDRLVRRIAPDGTHLPIRLKALEALRACRLETLGEVSDVLVQRLRRRDEPSNEVKVAVAELLLEPTQVWWRGGHDR